MTDAPEVTDAPALLQAARRIASARPRIDYATPRRHLGLAADASERESEGLAPSLPVVPAAPVLSREGSEAK
jgi:hypothetical protein